MNGKKLYFYDKKGLAFFLLLLFCLVGFGSFYLMAPKEQGANSPAYFHTIVIDAGHGGIDGGVIGSTTGALESDINLAIALKLSDLFKEKGFNAILTRKTSAGLYGHTGAGHKKRDMRAREKIMKQSGADLFISIHQNKFSDSNRRGGQVFYKAGYEKGKQLATVIQSQINNLPQNGRISSALVGDYYLLNVCPYPAVIVECGFLSNPQDENLLINSEYQQEIALAIFRGAVEYLISA